MGKDDRLHFRLDADARKRLLEVCELTGLDEPTAMRACINAFIEYVEAYGEIRLPLVVLPRSEADRFFNLPPRPGQKPEADHDPLKLGKPRGVEAPRGPIYAPTPKEQSTLNEETPSSALPQSKRSHPKQPRKNT